MGFRRARGKVYRQWSQFPACDLFMYPEAPQQTAPQLRYYTPRISRPGVSCCRTTRNTTADRNPQSTFSMQQPEGSPAFADPDAATPKKCIDQGSNVNDERNVTDDSDLRWHFFKLWAAWDAGKPAPDG